MMDSRVKIETLAATKNPQTLIFKAAHQDYSPDFVYDESFPLTDSHYGELIIRNLLSGNRGHFGCFEHPSITLACGFIPHSVMQQIRTHRVGITFDCQSFRYTGTQVIDVANLKRPIEDVFYLRPVGWYTDRSGKKYEYTEGVRNNDKLDCLVASQTYALKIQHGMSEEHARSMLPFDYRQHFVMSVNVRSLMHLLDLRGKKDAQLECQWFSDLLFIQFEKWVPEIATWYKENRYGKARLSP